MDHTATGTGTGTGANIDVNIGFTPCYVRVINLTSGDQFEWFDSMTNAHALKRVAAGTGSAITSGGVTPLNDGTTLGFRIGTDTDVNAAGETYHYLALRV